MITWILILTLLSSHGAGVHSVPGFATKNQCLSAGEAWKAAMGSGWTKDYSSFACIEAGSK